MKWTIYRLTSNNYIGCTLNPKRRCRVHKSEMIMLAEYNNPCEASRAEQEFRDQYGLTRNSPYPRRPAVCPHCNLVSTPGAIATHIKTHWSAEKRENDKQEQLLWSIKYAKENSNAFTEEYRIELLNLEQKMRSRGADLRGLRSGGGQADR